MSSVIEQILLGCRPPIPSEGGKEWTELIEKCWVNPISFKKIST